MVSYGKWTRMEDDQDTINKEFDRLVKDVVSRVLNKGNTTLTRLAESKRLKNMSDIEKAKFYLTYYS